MSLAGLGTLASQAMQQAGSPSSPIIPPGSSLAAPAAGGGGFLSGVGNFLGDFGKSALGAGVKPGQIFPDNANLAQILGTILGNTSVQTGNFSFQGGAQGNRKRGLEQMLLQMLGAPTAIGGDDFVVQSNQRTRAPKDATSIAR